MCLFSEINDTISPCFDNIIKNMQIIIPVDSGDKPKRSPPSRFAARMQMQESEKSSTMKKEQPEVVESTSSIP